MSGIPEAFAPPRETRADAWDHPPGPVAGMARAYSADLDAPAPAIADRLLGFLLSLSYEEVTIVTCDPWKRACGGVPRNSFVLVRLSPRQVTAEDRAAPGRLAGGRRRAADH